MKADEGALREQYLAAIEHEIAEGRARLSRGRDQVGGAAPHRVEALVAISDVSLDWLEGERDRLRAGGAFDEVAARRFLGDT